MFDEWQAVYLKGFEPGRNWVQLELIDEAGNPIDNRFNNTVRVIDYEPGGDDTLSKLVRGELGVKEVAGIIDPTYEPPTLPETEAEVAPLEEEIIPESEEVTPKSEAAPELEAAPAEAPEKAPESEEAIPGEASEMPEAEAAPAEDTSKTRAEEEAVPAEPQAPALVTPPVAPEAPEPTTPKPPEPSDLVPEVTPEDIQEGSISDVPQAQEEEQPTTTNPQNTEAPAPEPRISEPEAEDLETTESVTPKEEVHPVQSGQGGDTLQAPASLSTEKTQGGKYLAFRSRAASR